MRRSQKVIAMRRCSLIFYYLKVILLGVGGVRPTSLMNTCCVVCNQDIVAENEFEASLLANVIPPSETGVTFDDIGALEAVKDTLKELIMLPLKMPELFRKGKLTKSVTSNTLSDACSVAPLNLTSPCKGILLFGPPGTGKTKLAKAIATEAGATFINISNSSITSKVPGESEKYVKAVFSLASKASPCIIFIDEETLLAEGGYSEKGSVVLDGFLTKDTERVLVLAATNKPFDLDEAVIWMLPRKIDDKFARCSK
ncbi:ATP binding protein [Trifolium pratense]|uniref:ATP binding protein n=1 Tax=Trifolium pratense TaxID=57577 RepID=A0A2K3NCH7_TRIPR|nr:ATP binding protein [Trifolium pratense]